MAEDDLPDREVSRLLSLTADQVGRGTAPDPAGLVRRAGRRQRARHTGSVVAVLVAVLAVVVPVGVFAAGRATTPPRPADSAAPAPSPLGTAAALAAGHWQDLPPAPISPRTSPAYAWTGSQLLVWGGNTPGAEAPTRLSDGASYDPATKTWQLLPAGPLKAVPNPVSAWTGTQWLILGSTPSDTTITQQLVSYDPAARTWTELALPKDRLLLRAVGLTVTAAWTGRELVVIGFESPAGDRGVAAYDPSTATWRNLPDLPASAGQGTRTREAGAVDGDVVVLSDWDRQGNDGTIAGVSSWRLDLEKNAWTKIRGAEPGGMAAPVATGVGLLVPGARGGCGATVDCQRPGGTRGRQLRPSGWSALPESPVEDGRGVWTGSALVVADAQAVGPGPAEVTPGKAAAYDPTDRTWTALPDAGGPGTDGGVVIWTGHALIVWGAKPCGPAQFCVKQTALQTGRVLVPALPQPAAGQPTQGPGVGRVSFLPEKGGYPMALLTGALGGDPKTGCLWVDPPSGQGDRVAFRLHEDTAELDVSAQPPTIRDGTQVIAAFGDQVEMGGGYVGSPAPGCTGLGDPFVGHDLQRVLPGAPPTVTLTDLRGACGPADGPELAGTLTMTGAPRVPLDLEVDAPDGTALARVQLSAVEGANELAVALDPFKTLVPPDALPEWDVRVSEHGQVLAQVLFDLRTGRGCTG